MRTSRLVGLLLASTLTAACGGSGEPALTTVVTTTTVAGTAPPLPALQFSTPLEAAKHLILQWQANDREAALQAALPEAVTAIFAKPSKVVQFRSCDTSPSSNLGSDCAYRYLDGILKLHLTVTSNNWRVATVAFEGV